MPYYYHPSNTKLQFLYNEVEEIKSGKVGYPRVVEWQKEFVTSCYEALPALLNAYNATNAFRCVDNKDWEWLFNHLDCSGHGRFWREVLEEFRVSLYRR